MRLQIRMAWPLCFQSIYFHTIICSIGKSVYNLTIGMFFFALEFILSSRSFNGPILCIFKLHNKVIFCVAGLVSITMNIENSEIINTRSVTWAVFSLHAGDFRRVRASHTGWLRNSSVRTLAPLLWRIILYINNR